VLSRNPPAKADNNQSQEQEMLGGCNLDKLKRPDRPQRDAGTHQLRALFTHPKDSRFLFALESV
jgi:hypothetical protein